MARVLSRESDLLTYIQVVALSFDSLGKPERFPASRSFPTSHVFRIVQAGSKLEAWAVIKCVHWQHITETKQFSSTFLVSFDLTAPEVPIPMEVTPSMDHNSNADDALDDDQDEKIDEALPYIGSKDLIGDDESWLENLLTWVDDDEPNKRPGATNDGGLGGNAIDAMDLLDLPLAD